MPQSSTANLADEERARTDGYTEILSDQRNTSDQFSEARKG